MKTTLTILLIVFCVSVSGQTVTTLGNKCVAYWDMETAAATEPSRVGSHDAIVSGATSTASGANGKGYSFDGTNDVLSIAAIALGNNLSISAWIKASTTGLTYRQAVGRNYGNSSVKLGGTGKYTGAVNGTSAQSASAHDANWHFIVVTKNHTTNTISLYLDGSLISSTTNTDAEEHSDKVWQIGAHGNSSEYWSGTIDEVGLWSSTLTVEDVAILYSSGTAPDFDHWYYEPTAGTYNPIPGRHMRFLANGVEVKDKGRDGTFQYWLAKKQSVQTYTQIDLAQDRTYILSGDAQDYDWVGELQASNSWRIHEGGTIFYSFNINEDTSGLFDISSNVIYCKDVSAMQSSKTYAITYSVYDGYFYDVAKVYIYKPPADSCITVTNWTGYDNKFKTGYYYFQPRGSVTTVIEQIDINVNDVYFGSIGTGNLPILNKGWPNNTAMEGMFYAYGKTGLTFQSLYFDPNGYGSLNPYYSCGIFTRTVTNLTIDNCSFISDLSGDLLDMFAYPARLEGTSNVTYSNNTISGALYDGAYISGSTGGNIINNRVTHVNQIHAKSDWTYKKYAGGDVFYLRAGTSGGSFNVRHNYGNKEDYPCKSILVLHRIGTSLPGSDTIEFNYFKGYAETSSPILENGGTTFLNIAGINGSVIRYNIVEDCGRFAFTTSQTTTYNGTEYTMNGNENNKFYYNLCINAYVMAMQFTATSNGNQVYNNTFAGYGTQYYDGYLLAKGAISTGGFDVDVVNNIFYQDGVNPYYGSEGTGTIDYNLYNNRGTHTLRAHEIEDDPEFNADYTLKSISPAINAGTTTISGGLGHDLKRVPIPNGLYDMGCYEGAYNY